MQPFDARPAAESVAGVVTVAEAVQAELESFGDLAGSGLAAAALALAAEIDRDGNSATSKSMCARELRETLAVLRALAPPQESRDGIDELERKRRRRRGGVDARGKKAKSQP